MFFVFFYFIVLLLLTIKILRRNTKVISLHSNESLSFPVCDGGKENEGRNGQRGCQAFYEKYKPFLKKKSTRGNNLDAVCVV